MEQWLRDALAEEMGYVICPLAIETYTICDENCEECEIHREFVIFRRQTMNNEIEVGEYVRNNKGNIGKVIGIFDGHCTAKYHIEFQGDVKVKRQYLSINTIIKHSKIRSEIVEVGDYVNGKLIHKIDKGPNYCYLYYGNCKTFVDYQIKTIVTKESFKEREYVF